MEDQRKVKKQSTGVLEAMKFLKSLPSEKNGISNIWKSVEIEAKNALETQANLEIYQQFCAINKCLDFLKCFVKYTRQAITPVTQIMIISVEDIIIYIII